MTKIFPPAPPVGTPMLPTRPSAEARRFLSLRRSANKAMLTAPGPSSEQIYELIEVATRVPDHRRLSPWRFIIFEGDARKAFGEGAAEVQRNENPSAETAAIEATKTLLLRAPTVVAIVSSPVDDGKTPVWEQELSAGAVTYNLLLAANAAGWSGVWLSEWITFSKGINNLLGIAENERLAGFIYLGTATTRPQERARPDPAALVSAGQVCSPSSLAISPLLRGTFYRHKEQMLSFLKTNVKWIAGGFLLTFFSSFGQTFFIGLSGEELRAKFSLSDGEFGLAYMFATLGSAFTLPWLGRTLDMMPGRMVTRFVIPCLAGACLLIAFAPNVLIMIAALYLLRLFGQGMMTHTALTEIGRWFSANRGRATSLVVPGHQTGEALLPISFAIIAAGFGWQVSWLVGAALLVFFALPAIQLLWAVERAPRSEADPVLPSRTARDWTLRETLRDPVFYALLIGVLAPPFIGTTVFFHQDYLIELRGYNPLAFAGAFPLMAVTTVIFSLYCGALIDRFGASRLLPFFLLPLAVASAAAALLTPVWGIYVFMILMGVSYGFTSTLLGALWPEAYGLANLGSIRSVVVSAMVFSTALGPGLTGTLIDAGINLPSQLLWMSLWCVLACGVLGLVSPRLAERSSS